MQKVNVQTSGDVYEDMLQSMEKDKAKFLRLLKEHIKLETLIPAEFYRAFYKDIGRPRDYSLEGIIWFHQLKNIIGIPKDSTFLIVLAFSPELREFCGFKKLPAASELTRFRQSFADYLEILFKRLVEVTEPICRKLDPKKSDYLIYDPTGIKAYVTENNPKFFEAKLAQAKTLKKKNPQYDPYKGVYSLLPETSQANPFVKQQHINGHFCYAHKAGILTNGIGIVRHIAFFDERFRRKHPEVVSQKTDNPDLDKEIGDSTSLKPVLSDFFYAHPTFSYKTFIADSSFDSVDNYTMLRNQFFKFDRICIPLNPRNSSNAHNDFDANGTPICPIDNTPFTFIAICRGKNRSERYKWVCHKSLRVRGSPTKRFCTCDFPCTTSSYGRTTYTYPNKNLRLYPGIPRGTQHWNNLYRHRTYIERTVNIFKDDFGVAHRKSFAQSTAKSDLFLAGITQLLGVIFADAVHLHKFFKSVRKLFSA